MNEIPTSLDSLVRRHAREGCGHGPERVKLWDGVEHCLGCVEAACPGLAGLAKQRDCLEDSIVYDQASGMQTWWKIFGLFFAVLVLAGVGIAAALDAMATLILVGSMGLCLGFGAFGSLFKVSYARQILPTVRVRDGLVEVYRPNHGHGQVPVATFRLTDARWRPGKLQEDSSCRGRGGAIVADQRVVILRSPQRWKGVSPPSEYTAIGSTPEMVRLWQVFLRIAGVPEGK